MRFRRLLVAAGLVTTGCSGGGSGSGASHETPCPEPSRGGDRRLLPRDIPLEDWGTLAETRLTAGYIGATAVGSMPIVELYPRIARTLLGGGYRTVSADNEGFEAEIFFVRGRATNGSFILREGPCGDQVTIKLLYSSPRHRRLSRS